MNEDDTFRVLSRPSIIELLGLYATWNNSGTHTKEEADSFFIGHKWTIDEFEETLLNHIRK